MATLNVRNIPEDLYARLRIRAAEAGESMEGFVRARLDLLIEPATAEARPSRPRTVREVRARLDRLFGEDRPTDLMETLKAMREEERRDAHGMSKE
ncbi:MAG: hypothetical protein NXI21_01030 [Alphaproteobacteria bacterium]|nr:hypothetical protein [Alphaproteobacteria bacterium]